MRTRGPTTTAELRPWLSIQINIHTEYPPPTMFFFEIKNNFNKISRTFYIPESKNPENKIDGM